MARKKRNQVDMIMDKILEVAKQTGVNASPADKAAVRGLLDTLVNGKPQEKKALCETMAEAASKIINSDSAEGLVTACLKESIKGRVKNPNIDELLSGKPDKSDRPKRQSISANNPFGGDSGAGIT